MSDLNNTFNIPMPGSPRFESDVIRALGKIRDSLGAGSDPSFGSIELEDATASRLTATDADKKLSSSDLFAWVAGTANEINVADDGDGTITIGIVDPLIVGKGGTGAATLTDHGILLGSGTGAVTPLGVATNGQIPIGSTGADPVLATLTGTANQIIVTNAAGSITLSTPQDIHTGATPTFADLIVTDRLLIDSTDFITNLGYLAGGNTTGIRNVNLGAYTGVNLTTGEKNVNIGYYAGYGLTGGIANTGSYNMYLGHNTGPYNTTGSYNVAIGGNTFNRNTEGSYNTVIGASAGFLSTAGASNIFVGNQAGFRQTTASNILLIDNQDRVTAANELTKALLYGVFAVAPADQTLTINGEILGSVGAKIGDGGTTDYSEFEADGTLEFHGAATVWRDANVGTLNLGTGTGATRPTVVSYYDEAGADTGIACLGFATGESVSGAIEFQHDYKEGSDITFHIHWQGIAAPTGTDQVKWQLEYTVARDTLTLDAPTTIVVETAFDTQYAFERSDLPVITGTNFKVGDQLLFKLQRIVAAGDAYAGDALATTVGFHYECDTVGSRDILTK